MIRIAHVVVVAGLALSVLVIPQGASADFTVIHTFLGGDDGEYPLGGLTIGGRGKLLGTTFGALGSGAPGKRCGRSCGNIYGYSLISGEQKALYSFQGGENDGAFPVGEVVFQPDTKAILGTTEYGPSTNCGGLGCGTAFRLGRHQTVTEAKFCLMANCADGAFPRAGLAADGSGNFYGTTILGGTGNGALCGSNLGGCGIIYQLIVGDKRLNINPLYSFCSKPGCVDGAVPLGRLLYDASTGELYGTTEFGGAYSEGTIFKLSPSVDGWQETVIYSFCKSVQNNICLDGSVPEAGLIADSAGNLYGTTVFGGEDSCDGFPGCGVVFEIAPNGTYTVLSTFRGGDDGSFPQAPLAMDDAGNLYGSTLRGGGSANCNRGASGCGTIFMIPPGGSEVPLYSFTKGTDGAQPEGALLLDNGYLYGAARIAGDPVCGCGTLFRIGLQAQAKRHSRQLIVPRRP
jgi:uncharacterized repeat protein (TIGR03803 family)